MCELEMCGICLDDLLPENNIITLKCNHKYCYECIYQSYLKNKIKLQCPYCRKNGGYLPLPPSTIPKKNIHKEYSTYLLPLTYSVSHYKKTQLVEIAEKLGISLYDDNYKKKLKLDLYHEIKLLSDN